MSDTASAAPRVPKRVAAVILNSLKGGVVPRIGLPYITVGREVEIRALLTDLSLIADGGASFRFLVGRYGAGKSFLLQTIRTHAMGEGFVVAFPPSAACRVARARVWPPIASLSATYRPKRAPRAARSILSWIAGSPRVPTPTSRPSMPSLPRSKIWFTASTSLACSAAIARQYPRATRRP